MSNIRGVLLIVGTLALAALGQCSECWIPVSPISPISPPPARDPEAKVLSAELAAAPVEAETKCWWEVQARDADEAIPFECQLRDLDGAVVARQNFALRMGESEEIGLRWLVGPGEYEVWCSIGFCDFELMGAWWVK